MAEEVVLAVDEQGEAALEALLAQSAPWQDATKSARTLDEMLTGLTSIATDWPGRYYRSPKIKHVKTVGHYMQAVKDSDEITVLAIQEALICFLVCVPDGKKLRRVTPEEIEEHFHPDDLQPFINKMMARDGFSIKDDEENAVAPKTGA